MPIEIWFPTPIYVEMLSTETIAICQSELSDIIYSDVHDMTNPWGDTVETSFKYDSKTDILSKAKRTQQIFLDHCNNFLTLLNLDCKIRIKESWFNISNTNNFQRMHLHNEYDISGIYYFQASENSGDVVFQNPSLVNRYHKLTSSIDSKVNYQPSTGKLLLFPSFLEHEVLPNMSKNKRISVAFNANIEK